MRNRPKFRSQILISALVKSFCLFWKLDGAFLETRQLKSLFTFITCTEVARTSSEIPLMCALDSATIMETK